MRPISGQIIKVLGHRKYGASKLGSPHAKEFLQTSSEIWVSALRNVPQMGRQIINP